MAAVGLEMGMCVLVGWGIGYYLDGRFDTKPTLMIIFLLLGIAAGFKGLYRAARITQKRFSAADSDTGMEKPEEPN